jgi:DNA-binding NarL/FixJ family response regulator
MAATLFAAARALREQIGAPMPEPDRRMYDRFVAALRRSLPAETFAARWADGERLTLAEAVARAATVAHGPHGPDSPLSDREIDVLRLVAAGLTNGQVAERLYLSRRTVDAHMRRIYDKLDLASRGDVIRYAVDHGLA